MKISIVTPTFNAGSTIAEALQSVGQLDDGMEHLLVDAASKDNTLEVAGHFTGVRIFSEPDKGIYDGMNKGAELARGKWLLFLQGDDWLPKGALAAFRDAIAGNPDAEMICGDCEAVRNVSGNWESVWFVTGPASKKLTIKNIALGEPMINARLIRKDIFQRLGGFSLKYSLASDRDFLLRCAASGIRQAEIPYMTYRYRWHAGSSTMTEGNALSEKLRGENLRIAQRHQELVSDCDKEAIRDWRANLAIEQAMNAIERPNVKLFIEAFRHGMSSQTWWVFFLFSEIMMGLPGYFGRGCRTRSMARSSRMECKT
jgi:glycosyltransferase involved in cell wall biosynthesis